MEHRIWIFVLGIFSILCYLFIRWIYSFLKERYELNHLTDENPFLIAMFIPKKTSLVGDTGTGKSYFINACAQELTKYIDYELKSRMEEIRIKLDTVNFNYIQSYIDSLMKDNLSLKENEVYKEFEKFIAIYTNNTNKIFDKTRSHEEFETYFSDFITFHDKKEMLLSWMKAYYITIYRKKYVVSGNYHYNIFSEELATIYDPSSLELRNVIKNNNWQFGPARIILDSEQQIRDSNSESNNNEKKRAGTKDTMALIRNAGDLNWIFSDRQVSTDLMKALKDQYEAHILPVEMREFSTFPNLRRFLSWCAEKSYFWVKFRFSVKALFNKKFDKYMAFKNYKNENNRHRKLEKNLLMERLYLKRNGFIRIRLRNYHRAEDVGKDDLECYEPLDFYFPYYYFGSYDTHGHRFVFDELNKNHSSESLKSKIKKYGDDYKWDIFEKNLSNKGHL